MTDNSQPAEHVQRSLGLIEGAQIQILSEIKLFREDLGRHIDNDQMNFSALRVVIATQKKEMEDQFTENDRARNQHLNEQDVKLDGIKQDQDRAKGAGWVILGLLTAFAGFLGTAAMSIWNGYIKIH